MHAGTIISGGAHAALIVAAMLGALDWGRDTLPPPRITKVTLVRAAALDVQSSSAPALPMSEIAQIAQPEISADSVVTPSAETAPTLIQPNPTAPPDAADTGPDLSALLPPTQPDVVVTAPTVQPADPHAEAIPDITRPPLDGNELNAPTNMTTPPPPRNAPRIDTSAAAKPPENAQTSANTTPEVSKTPADQVQPAPQPAAALPESSTQITPEGQRDVAISAYAPTSAVRPPRRVSRPAAQPDLQAQIDAALASTQASAQAAQPATQVTPPVQAELTGAEKSAIGDVVSPMWNKGNIIGQENFEQYVVRITVEVSATGAVESVAPLEPSKPAGLFDVAYQAARRAVYRAGEIPLPAGKFPNGVRLVLRFDPASGEIGFN